LYNFVRGFLAAMTIQITPSQLELYGNTARESEAKLRIQLDERQHRA
jgi:hypothetical protein